MSKRNVRKNRHKGSGFRGVWEWIELGFMIALALAALALVILVILSVLNNTTEANRQQEKLAEMSDRLDALKIEQREFDQLLDMVEGYQSTIQEIKSENDRLREILDKIGIDIFEITAYAPLDPNAIEGMCYEGDPNITASGARVEIGRTVAADTNVLPFGTRVWVQGFGWREVQDRGGAIKGNKIDVAVQSTSEAYGFGRERRVVVYARDS